MSSKQNLFSDTSIAFSHKDDNELRNSYLLFSTMQISWLVKAGTNMVKIALKLNLPVKGIIKKTVFKQFCGGESINECQKTIEALSKYGIGTILDYAVEGADNELSYENTADEVIKTIRAAADNEDIPFCVFKPTGLASAVILEKVQNKETLTPKESEAYCSIKERWFRVAKSAAENNVSLFVDSEESWYQKAIDEIVYELMEKFNKDKALIFNTYQLYRRNMMEELIKAHAKGLENGYYLGAKLVRGAYMEKERERAQEYGYDDPIMPTKSATDKQYDEALKFCIENIDRIAVCSGSHNEKSNYYLLELMRDNGIENHDKRIYFAQLFGMSDHISFNLAKAGFNVVKYVPYGPIKSVMPYLFRRAEENSSISGQTNRELALVKVEQNRRKNLKVAD
ncbi:MAG: proline dehydrogenase family protein [Cyclobacteriaceae bacterium]